MTRNQAVAAAKKMAAEGLSQSEIAAKLAEAGFRSSRTGAPYSNAGISYLTSSKKKRKARTSAARREAEPTRKRGSLDAIKSILKLKGMAAEERIALALLVLE